MSPRTRWYVVSFTPATILATMTAPSLLLGGNPLGGVVVLLAAATVAIQAWSFRARYKTGWHDGRVDLTRELAGDPDQASTGLAPEPWTPRRPGAVVLRRGYDDREDDA